MHYVELISSGKLPTSGGEDLEIQILTERYLDSGANDIIFGVFWCISPYKIEY